MTPQGMYYRCRWRVPLVCWFDGLVRPTASRKHWIMWDNSSSSMKNFFSFFFASLSWEPFLFLQSFVLHTLICTCRLHNCFVATGCFVYTQERRPFPSACFFFFFFGNSWILQRAESELSTLKRTISACELYTVLTPCLYSLDLFVRGKRRHFRKRDICHIQPCVCIFMFYGIF